MYGKRRKKNQWSKDFRKDIYDEDRERLLVTCHISKYILSWTLDLRRHVSCWALSRSCCVGRWVIWDQWMSRAGEGAVLHYSLWWVPSKIHWTNRQVTRMLSGRVVQHPSVLFTTSTEERWGVQGPLQDSSPVCVSIYLSIYISICNCYRVRESLLAWCCGCRGSFV